ncbi:protein FAM192A [Phalaenopsis equestris]|uniref:protein FAM192A n=1 Tax=Phalaenopsis equestris TaxID=78828 RepID=UPI0009E530AE|nr:protein FAM192A [Phalaenopsis equestris]XP_020573512.1 protein FAM192A [Phalaenopsis equestris]
MEEELQRKSIKLVNFVSEEQLDESRKIRGERVEDGTAQRDRPLYEILRENKEKKDAEFNERFKHRPPKALDEDETEFLEKLDMSRKEYERQIADDDANQLRSFQEAVASQASIVQKLKEKPTVPKTNESGQAAKRSQNTRPGNFIISVKPHAKKAKTVTSASGSEGSAEDKLPLDNVPGSTLGGLVSYSDESEDD